MPTIDQLPPAPTVNPTDEIMISQNGTIYKATQSQFVASAEPLFTVGANLVLNQGTLSATAAPYVVANLTPGSVPGASDLVPLGQSGQNVAVSYSQFMSGLSELSGVNASGMTVTPTGSNTQMSLGSFAANALMQSGGTLTGPLTLAADPISSLHSTTKQYVDGLCYSLEASGAKGDSVTDDTVAVNAFLASLPTGSLVRIPAGRFYLINSANLSVPTGICVEGASPFANPAHSGLFGGCGFLLNPAFSVVMNYASQLKSLKVLRAGLLSNPTASQVNQAVGTWAAEAFNLVSAGNAAVGASVLSFNSTAGVSAGMAVCGKGVQPGTTVTSVTSTTVTLSQPVAVAVSPGMAFRFGASIGIVIPVNMGNNVLEDLQIIGFRTGILAMAGEFFANRVQADCITVLEGTWAGDNAYLREFHCVPYYGIAQGNNSNCWRRPGPAFYLHDQTDGWTLCDFFALHWQTGYQLSNVGAVTLIRCGYEKIQDGWTGTTGFLWQGHEASSQCMDGYVTGAGVGLDMQHSGEVQLSAMSTVGSTDGTGIAHYRLGTGSYSAVYNAMINEAGPATPIVVQPSVVRWKIIAPFIDNGTVSPWISIDPSSVGSVDLLHVRDTNGFSPKAVESHLHEKLWITTDPSVATVDGSPQATLALEATTAGTGAIRNLSLLRSGAECGALQTLPSGNANCSGVALTATASGSDIMLVPGGGALVTAIPDGGLTGGAARGAGAVDLQMSRTAATQVASGYAAAIVGGTGNAASADHCVVGGNSNTVSATSGTAFGFANTVLGSVSAAPGGANAYDRGRVGTLVWSSDRARPPDCANIRNKFLARQRPMPPRPALRQTARARALRTLSICRVGACMEFACLWLLAILRARMRQHGSWTASYCTLVLRASRWSEAEQVSRRISRSGRALTGP